MSEATPPGMDDEDDTPDPDSLGFFGKLRELWRVEFANLRWRVLVVTLLMRLLPEGRAAHLRASLLRAIGVHIGAGTRVFGTPVLQSVGRRPLRARLRIGTNCTIGRGVILEFGEVVTIGDGVTLADRAVVITTTHRLGSRKHRAGPVIRNPVTIGNNAVIGANAIILPGAIIGDDARVLPDSVVNAKVAPGATVVGIPARPQRPAGSV